MGDGRSGVQPAGHSARDEDSALSTDEALSLEEHVEYSIIQVNPGAQCENVTRIFPIAFRTCAMF